MQLWTWRFGVGTFACGQALERLGCDNTHFLLDVAGSWWNNSQRVLLFAVGPGCLFDESWLCLCRLCTRLLQHLVASSSVGNKNHSSSQAPHTCQEVLRHQVAQLLRRAHVHKCRRLMHIIRWRAFVHRHICFVLAQSNGRRLAVFNSRRVQDDFWWRGRHLCTRSAGNLGQLSLALHWRPCYLEWVP